MWMAVLILKPRRSLPVRARSIEMRVEPPGSQTGPAKKRSPSVMDRAAIGTVQADQNIPSWSGELADPLERPPTVRRMVENSVGNNEVEEPILQCRTEEVHLSEHGTLEPVVRFELLRQPQ